MPANPLIESIPSRTGEYLVKEVDPRLSRKTVTIVSGSGVVLPGTVLGKVTASGKYAPLNLGAADGTQTAAAINYAEVDATSADVSAVVTLRLAAVNTSEMIYPTGATNNQIAAINVLLEALNIACLTGR